MNIQKLMQEAQKMQADLNKTQKELSNTEYEGTSSFVKVVVNGNKKVLSLKIDSESGIEKDEIELLEDMVMLAINDAMKKVDEDKEKKLSKYGNGLAGLM